MTGDEAIDEIFGQYALALVQQVEKAGGWPVCFDFPQPRNSAEQAAFSRFVALFEESTGIKVEFTPQPGRA
jgi:hypothetical protein